MEFCRRINIALVPLSPLNLARYVAYLSARLQFNSINNYLSIIRLLHLEAGTTSPLESFFMDSVLKGAKRVLGCTVNSKLPLTPKILNEIFTLLSLSSSKDLCFWVACLVAFFSFLRKSNLFAPCLSGFDPVRQLSREDITFHAEGVRLRVVKTKTIQFSECVLEIPLPRVNNSHLCPSKALLLNFKRVPAISSPSPVFLYLVQGKTPVKLSRTLLLPTVFIVVCSVVFKLLTEEYLAWKSPSSFEMQVDRNMRLKPNAEIVYNLFQCAAFTLMAIMIMRLKLFMTPHLCLITSLLASKKIFGWIGSREKQLGLVTIIAAGMTYQGITNLQHQWSIMGEYSNVPLEELVDWINAKTSKNAVFAGPMPTMATVKLTTLRPIVNHPHYEDAGLRERTKKVYSMYSRKPAEELKRLMKEMKVNYVILEDSWCNRRSKPGCQMAEIWDLEDRKNRGKEPLCSILQRDPKPYFKTVFKNAVYSVLKVI
ncbi:Probable C-mannosyltransferase DPY19L1,Probable C-mannosyltransferase DPY19L2,C-mannosyltransferase dpy-19 [Mytilus coruscus]|uniref:Probable C-mannosyltransferase DPY19L1,Probable C-mannosyltransferase DPY19L2,C-mannosyltransferase dpy-19 n=1 Tax=Mytilus coruscus TaxID=42192 RepID=A0A6J8C2L8_MYTCO|nr:Probable C-mannosyltransferase DPY19L1,Probable C-mannosyltransferase DPY19L2,C-mannosyltransferase dpy-19 [Mytilus coruscus]